MHGVQDYVHILHDHKKEIQALSIEMLVFHVLEPFQLTFL